MPITTNDIFINQPAVLNDEDFAGGRMSGNRVIDGDLNNLFDDITRLDRTVGRVSLRKPYVSAENADTTKWQGVHAILTEPAGDPGVFVTMFGRDSHVDQRIDAQQHLEQFLAAGPPTPYYAWDTQPEGALAVSLFTNPNNALPEGGETLVLSVERGSVNNGEVQFVRVVSATSELVQVQSSGQSVEVRVLTIEIDQPLRFDVPGEPITSRTIAEPRTVVRRTTVAGGKSYYSVHALTAAAAIGDTTLQLDRTFTPVVPSNQQQTGITDVQVGSDTLSVVAIAAESAPLFVEAIAGASIQSGAVVHIAQRKVIPGSATVVIQWSGSSTRGVFTDDGRGNLVRDASSGGSVPAGAAGRIDYAFGEIVITGLGVTASVDASDSSVTYRPGAAIADVQHTDGIEITEANRGLVYTRTLAPTPRPGSLQIEYRVQGRWITLRERGDGTIGGNPGEGSGTLQFATGSVNLTLGAEPDVGSYVLFGWGSGIHYPHSVPSGSVKFQAGTVKAELEPTKGIAPGSLSLTYDDGGTTRTITDDGLGSLGGDGVGLVRYATGAIEFEPDALPAAGAAAFSASYDRQDRIQESPAGASGGGVSVYTLSGTPAPETLEGRLVYARANGGQIAMRVQVDDNGILRIVDAPTETLEQTVEVIIGYNERSDGTYSSAFSGIAGATANASGAAARGGTLNVWQIGQEPIVGEETRTAVRGVRFPDGAASFNSSTGEVSVSETLGNAYALPQWTGASWRRNTEDLTLVSAEFEYVDDAATPATQTQDIALNAISASLAEGKARDLQPGGLLFVLNGRQYYDRAGVIYYRDGNGQEISAGGISYSDADVTLSDWLPGTLAVDVIGAVVTYGRWTLTDAFWRVDAQQVQPGSYQLTYLRVGEETADQATADQGGDISGAGGLTGTVDFDTGVYALAWTDEVLPEEARYNAVAVEFLPVDPDVIGLDPVRLPANGRVPTLRAGDVVVIHHTLTTTLPNPVVPDTAYSLRPGISVAEVFDADDVRVPTDRFTVDKVAGEITFPSPLNLDDFTQPLYVRHRIEDMKQCTDAQLSGAIQVNTALTHDYPADGNSYVSSALILDQELFAAAFNLFTQQSWTNEWSDERIGNGTDGQYDVLNFPIEVTNQGAIRERWRIEFTSVTAFRIVGETVGEVATSDTSTDVSPINPATGAPYFTIRAGGWSAGWDIGNQIRFNTQAAHAPIWINRTTLPGDNTQDPVDQFRLEARGDAN
ncbi:MAG: hypothetical protein RJP96_14735 [Algiphilus sp.]|uniref:hypothetical protein n=2 Tax=Algiphilus sp. TaxID=1872431 RepID=UPI0032EFA64D